MKVAIDCRHIDSSGGIGVYLRECLPFFLDTANEFLLLGDTQKLNFTRNYPNIKIIPCSIKPFSLQDTFLFPLRISKKINNCDLFYTPYFNIPGGLKIPAYTTIHDIIFPDMPELTSGLGLCIRMYFYKRCFKRSRKIFTVSEFSKSRIDYYTGGKVAVIVTYNAIQSYLLENPDKTQKIVKKDLILFIGNIKKHKGLHNLLAAYREARKYGLSHKLLIVGNAGNFRSKDNEFNRIIKTFKSGEVEFTGFLPNDDIYRLLREASLLVQPSLYEGFGYPPLEAMISGTTVLISDIPVFKEIYNGFPVHYFKAGDQADLKEKLLSILLHKEPETINLSRELREKYTFKKTTDIIKKELGIFQN